MELNTFTQKALLQELQKISIFVDLRVEEDFEHRGNYCHSLTFKLNIDGIYFYFRQSFYVKDFNIRKVEFAIAEAYLKYSDKIERDVELNSEFIAYQFFYFYEFEYGFVYESKDNRTINSYLEEMDISLKTSNLNNIVRDLNEHIINS